MDVAYIFGWKRVSLLWIIPNCSITTVSFVSDYYMPLLLTMLIIKRIFDVFDIIFCYWFVLQVAPLRLYYVVYNRQQVKAILPTPSNLPLKSTVVIQKNKSNKLNKHTSIDSNKNGKVQGKKRGRKPKFSRRNRERSVSGTKVTDVFTEGTPGGTNKDKVDTVTKDELVDGKSKGHEASVSDNEQVAKKRKIDFTDFVEPQSKSDPPKVMENTGKDSSSSKAANISTVTNEPSVDTPRKSDNKSSDKLTPHVKSNSKRNDKSIAKPHDSAVSDNKMKSDADSKTKSPDKPTTKSENRKLVNKSENKVDGRSEKKVTKVSDKPKIKLCQKSNLDEFSTKNQHTITKGTVSPSGKNNNKNDNFISDSQSKHKISKDKGREQSQSKEKTMNKSTLINVPSTPSSKLKCKTEQSNVVSTSSVKLSAKSSLVPRNDKNVHSVTSHIKANDKSKVVSESCTVKKGSVTTVMSNTAHKSSQLSQLNNTNGRKILDSSGVKRVKPINELDNASKSPVKKTAPPLPQLPPSPRRPIPSASLSSIKKPEQLKLDSPKLNTNGKKPDTAKFVAATNSKVVVLPTKKDSADRIGVVKLPNSNQHLTSKVKNTSPQNKKTEQTTENKGTVTSPKATGLSAIGKKSLPPTKMNKSLGQHQAQPAQPRRALSPLTRLVTKATVETQTCDELLQTSVSGETSEKEDTICDNNKGADISGSSCEDRSSSTSEKTDMMSGSLAGRVGVSDSQATTLILQRSLSLESAASASKSHQTTKSSHQHHKSKSDTRRSPSKATGSSGNTKDLVVPPLRIRFNDGVPQVNSVVRDSDRSMKKPATAPAAAANTPPKFPKPLTSSTNTVEKLPRYSPGTSSHSNVSTSKTAKVSSTSAAAKIVSTTRPQSNMISHSPTKRMSSRGHTVVSTKSLPITSPHLQNLVTAVHNPLNFQLPTSSSQTQQRQELPQRHTRPSQKVHHQTPRNTQTTKPQPAHRHSSDTQLKTISLPSKRLADGSSVSVVAPPITPTAPAICRPSMVQLSRSSPTVLLPITSQDELPATIRSITPVQSRALVKQVTAPAVAPPASPDSSVYDLPSPQTSCSGVRPGTITTSSTTPGTQVTIACPSSPTTGVMKVAPSTVSTSISSSNVVNEPTQGGRKQKQVSGGVMAYNTSGRPGGSHLLCSGAIPRQNGVIRMYHNHTITYSLPKKYSNTALQANKQQQQTHTTLPQQVLTPQQHQATHRSAEAKKHKQPSQSPQATQPPQLKQHISQQQQPQQQPSQQQTTQQQTTQQQATQQQATQQQTPQQQTTQQQTTQQQTTQQQTPHQVLQPPHKQPQSTPQQTKQKQPEVQQSHQEPQPSHQQQHKQPSHQQPLHQQPSQTQPSHQQPSHQQPRPSHQQPPHQQQPHQQPQPSHQQPPHQTQQPHQQPQPSHQHPPHQQPSHQQPPQKQHTVHKQQNISQHMNLSTTQPSPEHPPSTDIQSLHKTQPPIQKPVAPSSTPCKQADTVSPVSPDSATEGYTKPSTPSTDSCSCRAAVTPLVVNDVSQYSGSVVSSTVQSQGKSSPPNLPVSSVSSHLRGSSPVSITSLSPAPCHVVASHNNNKNNNNNIENPLANGYDAPLELTTKKRPSTDTPECEPAEKKKCLNVPTPVRA